MQQDDRLAWVNIINRVGMIWNIWCDKCRVRDCAKIFCSLILVPSVSALHVDFDLKCTGVYNHRGWWWSQLKNAGVHHIRATYYYEDLIARDIAVHWELKGTLVELKGTSIWLCNPFHGLSFHRTSYGQFGLFWCKLVSTCWTKKIKKSVGKCSNT